MIKVIIGIHVVYRIAINIIVTTIESMRLTPIIGAVLVAVEASDRVVISTNIVWDINIGLSTSEARP